MNEGYWLYLLSCRDGRTYVGISKDPMKRYAEHAAGRGSTFTKINPPVALLGAQYVGESLVEARRAEAALKKQSLRFKLRWANLRTSQLSIDAGGCERGPCVSDAVAGPLPKRTDL